MMDEEVFLGANGYGGGPCDGTIPFPDDINNIV